MENGGRVRAQCVANASLSGTCISFLIIGGWFRKIGRIFRSCWWKIRGREIRSITRWLKNREDFERNEGIILSIEIALDLDYGSIVAVYSNWDRGLSHLNQTKYGSANVAAAFETIAIRVL